MLQKKQKFLGKSYRSALLSFFFFFSCQYHCLQSRPVSVRVPFVEGDQKGLLTAQLVHKIYQNPFLSYREEEGNFCLKVSIIDFSQKQIGYQREREKIDGSLKRAIRPIEGRLFATASVQLIESTSDKVVWGPVVFSSEVDFDYVEGDSFSDLSFINRRGKRETVLDFSLGQLEPIESATEAALTPLFHKLSQKIVDQVVGHLASLEDKL